MGQPQTFAPRELPADRGTLQHDRPQRYRGISMAGTSVNLAIHKPSLYKAIAAFSGCARTSDWLGQQYIKLVVDRGDGNIENMGPARRPRLDRQRPHIQAAKLRGMSIYLTAGSGLPGQFDNLKNPTWRGQPLDPGQSDGGGRCHRGERERLFARCRAG